MRERGRGPEEGEGERGSRGGCRRLGERGRVRDDEGVGGGEEEGVGGGEREGRGGEGGTVERGRAPERERGGAGGV